MNVRRVTTPKGATREEWLGFRKPFVGASEAAALFGDHPFLSLGDLAAEKLGTIERPENRAMIRGRMLEDAVARWYAAEAGVELEEPEVLYVVVPEGEELGVLCATLDREIVGTRRALEVKTSANYVHGIEPYWRWQAQTQILCADLEAVEIAALDASLDLQTFTVTPDVEAHEMLVKAALAFLTHIRAGELPPDAALSLGAVKRLYPDPIPEPVELGHGARSIIERLRFARRRVRELSGDADRLQAQLIGMLHGHTIGTIEGAEAVSYGVSRRSEIDVKRLRADHPELAREYMRESTYRSVRLK